jgi:hypothetical protein
MSSNCRDNRYGGAHNASVELGSGMEEGGALSSVIL